ncbi:MAG TPA: cell division protein FtsL [Gammaproteobacteria bacterium]|jgi:cell division protein FtsL|nr:cell division protein FtsL [Gammaproteobacteria bacterium]HIK76656.1 cell division protein FtsL [Gammaproteobacteria bacterium]
MKDKLNWYKWPLFWFLMVAVTATYEIDTHYKNRELFKQYQLLVKQQDQLEIKWKELRLDLSELLSGMSLEKEANEKASMQLPDSSKIKVLLINEDKQ